MLALMAGMNIQMLGRSQLAWDLTGNNFSVGLVSAGFAPPMLLFSLFGGLVADRLEKKRIMQIGQFGMGLIGLFIALSIVTQTVTIYHLIGASVAQGTFFAFLMPSRQAIIPELVEPDQVTNAVALNASGMAFMTTMAPAIAGFLYSVGGASTVYFTISGLSFLAVVLTGRIPKLPGRPATSKSASKALRDIGDGLRYAWHNRTVILLLLLTLSTTVLAMPVRNLLAPYNDEVFGQSALGLGFMMAMIGVGALIGTLVIAGLTTAQPRGRVLLTTTFASAIAIILTAVLSNFFVILAVMVLLGIGDSGRRSLNTSLIMEQCDDEHRGRVMGIFMLNFGMISLGVLPLGLVANTIGIQPAFGIYGCILAATTLALTLGTRRIRSL